MPYGLIPSRDALLIEKQDENGENPYVNVVVARTADKDNEVYKKVVEAYQTQLVAEFLLVNYHETFFPAFPYDESATFAVTEDNVSEISGYKSSKEGKTVVKIGVCGGVNNNEQWIATQKVLDDEGANIYIELVEFDAYNLPNEALNSGDIDLNAFQHKAYLAKDCGANGYDLTVIGDTLIAPAVASTPKVRFHRRDQGRGRREVSKGHPFNRYGLQKGRTGFSCLSLIKRGIPMIQIGHMNKVFHLKSGDVTALDNVTLNIEDGMIYGVIGYSGAGKSTLVRCLNLLETPDDGTLSVGDSGVITLRGGKAYDAQGRKLTERKLGAMRRGIGMIFQHFNLLDRSTVFENIAYPLRYTGMKKADMEARVFELLDLVDLRDKADVYPPSFPAGRSSASPSPARWRTSRGCCSPTRRPAPSIRTRRRPF